MPETDKDQRKAEMEANAMSANNACAAPSINQVDAPADLDEGLPEPPDDERYVDEP